MKSKSKQMSGSKKIEIQLYRSVIGNPDWMRIIVRTLGLRRTQQKAVFADNPAIRGMVNKVPHLLKIREIEG